MPVLLLLLYVWVGGKGKDYTYFSYIWGKNVVLLHRNSQSYLTYTKISITEVLFFDLIDLRSLFMFLVLNILLLKKGLERSLNSCCLGQDHVPDKLTAWGSLLQYLTGKKQNYCMLKLCSAMLMSILCVCVWTCMSERISEWDTGDCRFKVLCVSLAHQYTQQIWVSMVIRFNKVSTIMTISVLHKHVDIVWFHFTCWEVFLISADSRW